MSVTAALALARDLAALATGALLLITAGAALSGAAGAGAGLGGLAASIATIAASGLLTLALFGLVSAVVETPLWSVLTAIGLAALIGGFAAAQIYGVRGLWITTLAVVGALVAAVILWTFMRHLGRPIGTLAPLLAAALLAATTFGALAASIRALPSPTSGASEPPWRTARAMFATPPNWFDCAYATFGGQAVRPGFCTFRPPQPVAEAPGVVAPAALDGPGDLSPPPEIAASDRTRDAIEAPVSEDLAAGPDATPAPEPPAAETPDFAPLRPNEDAAPTTPERLGPAPTETPAARLEPDQEAEPPAAPPEAPDAPEPTVAGPVFSETPPPLARPDAARVAVAAADSAPTPPDPDAAPEGALAPSERRRTEFVCFPTPGGLVDQLCPDDRLTPRDISVRWLGAGGEANAAVEQVECFREPKLALHATLVVDLNGAMVAPMQPGAAPAGRRRKIDAVYDMLTRLIVGARALSDDGAEGVDGSSLHLSAYIAGGSRLMSPWVSQQFGEDRVDRLFDGRSPRQTLTLVRRVQSEAQSLRRTAAGRDLVETLVAVIVERPDDPGPIAHSLIIAAVDAETAAAIEPARLAVLAERFRAAEMPLYLVALGEAAAGSDLARVAEATGGGAFAAATPDELSEIVDRLLLRTRTYCAVRVTAPDSFYEQSGLEVRLRRELLDGCQYEQVATMSCQGLSMRDRLIQAPR